LTLPPNNGTNHIASIGRRWPCVIDTNVLVRMFSILPHEQKERREAENAITSLAARSHPLYTTPLILLEFYRVATRKTGGLGLTESEVISEMTRLEAIAPCLEDTATVLAEWRTLLATETIPSAQVYDAYIAATMRVHPALQGQRDERGTLYPRLLTFNGNDFRRYAERQLFRVLPPRDVQGI
jgi:predicted nucleic acid-binding protein